MKYSNIIVIEDVVYKVTQKQFDEIKKINEKYNDEFNINEFLEENKHNYKLIGDIDYSFRL